MTILPQLGLNLLTSLTYNDEHDSPTNNISTDDNHDISNDNNENVDYTNSANINVHNNNGNFVFQELTANTQILKMPNNKSPGVDEMCPKLLKIAAPIICFSLAYICNLSLSTSIFPNE